MGPGGRRRPRVARGLSPSPIARRAIPRNRGLALEQARAIQQKVFGDDGQLAGATTRQDLATVLVAKGDLTGAIENLQQALALQRRIFERDDHPAVAATRRELERLQALQRPD